MVINDGDTESANLCVCGFQVLRPESRSSASSLSVHWVVT
jgi:hypothetical protein